MQFSFSALLSGLFLAYMLHSIYSLVQIFIPPSCSDKHCLKSFLSTKPKLELIICTSTKGSINRIEELTFVDQWHPFEYEKDFISKNVTIQLPWSTRRNGTLFLFAFVTPESKTPKDTWDQKVRYSHTTHAVFKLTQYLVPEAKTFNLLQDDDKKEEKKKKTVGKDKPIAHITKRLRLSMLTDLLVLPARDLPQDFGPLLRFISSDTYLPPLRFDKFNSRLKDFYPVNSSEDSYNMEFEFSPMSIGLIRMGFQFEQAMEMMQGIGFSVKDMDEVKGIFTETNVYLLTLTMLVASVHLLFDFLAFKNDIVYWQKRKTTVGLSSKTILWRCFSQIVVFLYLLEEKSSLLVIIPGGVGAVIEIWKVTKAYKVSIVIEGGMPRVRFGQLSASEKKTADHDVESMKYLSYILYPLILAGAVYSLLYTPHRSWYSWTIQSLVNGVYAFGFLFMLPQLFVNYRLKSVAHLPWRAFMYKVVYSSISEAFVCKIPSAGIERAFNTFIDDLFAFIITMPTAHRMACFRDDIVFLIYLYQRWLYPVDKSRLDAGGEFELEVDASQIQAVEKEVKSGSSSNGSNTKNKSQQKNKSPTSREKSLSDKKGD